MRLILLLVLAMIVSGCSTTSLKSPDGLEVTHTSVGPRSMQNFYMESDDFAAYIEKYNVEDVTEDVVSGVIEGLKVIK